LETLRIIIGSLVENHSVRGNYPLKNGIWKHVFDTSRSASPNFLMLSIKQSINQSINQSFYFRNKPISEIDRKTGETEETTKTLPVLILLKPIKA